MLNSAFTLGRSASRIQARTFTRASPRSARVFIIFTARDQDRKGSNGSQQSNRSRGQGSRYYRRLPLKSTAVAGFSALTALAKSDDQEKPQPNYAFKHPSGWGYLETDHPSLPYFFATKYVQAQDIKSIKDARIAHFNCTHTMLDLCVHGEIIDEGPAPNDIIFGLGQFVRREDVRILWVPSPVQGKTPLLCLSVHRDLGDEVERKMAFVHSAIEAGMGEYFLEKFKEDDDTYIHIQVHSVGQFLSTAMRRDELLHILEGKRPWAIGSSIHVDWMVERAICAKIYMDRIVQRFSKRVLCRSMNQMSHWYAVYTRRELRKAVSLAKATECRMLRPAKLW